MNFRLPALPDAETLGWGIIGASLIAAQSLIPALRALPAIDNGSRYPVPNSALLGIFSHSEHRARAFADHHAISHTFLNLEDLLAQPAIHCVYVSNHPRHHAQTVLAALAAGKHVLCEPPLALTVNEAQQVAHTALSRGLILGINYPRRADSAIRTLRELIADHTIGVLLGGRVSHTGLLPTNRQSWRLRSQGGGVLLDRTAHTVDLMRFLLRDEVETAYAVSTQQVLGDEVEEDILSIFTFRRTGLSIQTHDSFVVAHMPTSVELYGSTGALVVRHCWRADQPSELWLHRHGQTSPSPVATTDPFFATVQAFVQAVRTHGAPLAGGSDGVNNLAILQAAQLSLGRNQRIPVALPMRPVVDRAL